MSLHPLAVYVVPEDTARVARAAFPKGNSYLALRDELGAIFEDRAFATLFSARGRSAIAPRAAGPRHDPPIRRGAVRRAGGGRRAGAHRLEVSPEPGAR